MPKVSNVDVEEPMMFDKVVILSLEMKKIGNRRGVQTNLIETDAERSLLKITKQLMDSDELNACNTCQSQLRGYIAKRALQSNHLFKNGVYLLPISLVSEVNEEIRRYKDELAELVEDFIATYERVKQNARNRLKSLYDESEYPDVAVIRASFSIQHSFIQIGTATALKNIDVELFEQQQSEERLKWKQASEEITRAMRAAAHEFVEYMIDRMTPAPDGKRKTFKASAVETAFDFFDYFTERNIADDKELASVIERCRMMTEGVDAELLRSDDGLRNVMAQGFKEIKESMDGMMIDAEDTRNLIL